MGNKEWFKEAQFGIMAHFGLYSMLGGEWKGECMSYIGEWAQSYFRIPNKEYHKLADIFNPIYFNADEWIKLVKECGAKYFVITSKHHEGFALFKSEVSKFNVVDGSPFGRDIIAEIAEACYKYDIKLGLYYSQSIDWAHPDGNSGTKEQPLNMCDMSWGNEWDYPDKENKDYSRCFNEKIKPQVKEILTNYGDLLLMWFDIPLGIPEWCSQELYDMVKKYQPDCLVNSRIGNGKCDYTSAGDNVIPEYDVSGMLYESPVTLNDTWGYKPSDQNWKSPEIIIEIRNNLKGKGANLLLNVGPDGLGRIPAKSVEILRKVGELSR